MMLLKIKKRKFKNISLRCKEMNTIDIHLLNIICNHLSNQDIISLSQSCRYLFYLTRKDKTNHRFFIQLMNKRFGIITTVIGHLKPVERFILANSFH